MIRKSIALAVLAIAAVGCGSDGERTEAPRDVQPLAASAATATPAASRLTPASAPAPAAPADTDPVIATVDGNPIKRSEVINPLLEGYGLNVLLNVAQLEEAKEQCAERHLIVTPQDITAENDRLLTSMFKDASKDEYPQLLDQLLAQQRISKPEFDIFNQTNAYLHKIAEPLVKEEITDIKLQDEFKRIYGETVQVRIIQLTNLEEVTEAKRRLANGQAFQDVARGMSRNPQTAPTGGDLPPFSRYAAGYPESFKDAAFSLKPGEVSDPVQTQDAYFLIQMVQRFAPKVVKYEDVKETLRADLADRLMQARLKVMRTQMMDRIASTIKFTDPNSVLAKAYDLKKSQADEAIRGKDQIREAIKRDEQRAAIAATQKATTAPTAATKPTATTRAASTKP